MKILKSWLKDYIEFDLSDNEIDDKLTFSGTLVDSYVSGLDQNVIIAKIIDIKKHPNADRLKLVTITDGQKKYDIVCGADNIKVDQIVPFAKLGTKLGDFEIKKISIRGVESSGMLCSEKELGISENHEGIMILNSDYQLGKPLADYLDNDTVFDLEITPNRGDCLSHLGIARELSAVLHKKYRREPITLNSGAETASSKISVSISDKTLCPKYYARYIKNVNIGPSPKWLQDRLLKLGLKPINNVVDITNYIMLDLGQPLHAFDANKIEGNSIQVRRAKPGEEILTLDNESRKLSKNVLVIADSKKPIAIAGVMGGGNSEISETTKDIILEAAIFDRKNIRKTSKDLGIVTEASYRFERGIDFAGVEYAINKAAKMISELASGAVLSGIVKDEELDKEVLIPIEYEKINDLIGTDISPQETNSILKWLGFEITDSCAKVPSWRQDLQIWQDLAEEVARIYGFSNIEFKPIPKIDPPKKSEFYYKEYLKDLLVDQGFTEVFNYSFLSELDSKVIGLNTSELLEVINPIQQDIKYLRNSLIPGLLKSIAKNPTFDPILVFEIGNVFNKNEEKITLSIATSGKNARSYIEKAVEIIRNNFKFSADQLAINELTREELTRFKIKKPISYTVEVELNDIKKLAKFKEDIQLNSLPSDFQIPISHKRLSLCVRPKDQKRRTN